MTGHSNRSTRRRALIVLSSARSLPLAEPAGHPGVSTGVFLVELAQVLREFESDYDFVFATPDGVPPQLDINGLSLPFHAAERLGEISAEVAGAYGQAELDLAGYRQRYAALAKRRDGEIDLALRHLGRLRLSSPLPASDFEAVCYAESVLSRMMTAPERPWLSIETLLQNDRDPAQAFSLVDFDFAYFPGGHAPMVDFHDNPRLGELLRALLAQGVLLSLICHAPVAMTSTRGTGAFQGAALTTVPKAGEIFMLDFGYPRIPGQRTRLSYYVDDALVEAGFQVETTENAAAVHLVWDERFRLLTGNGPQAVDAQAARMRQLLSRA